MMNAIHPNISSPSSLRTGFTLMELLVVMGIIALTIGAFQMAFRDRPGSASLGSGQRIVAGLVQSARGQAILHQTNARLMVHNDPSQPEKFLRFLVIARETEPGSGQWIPTQEGVHLPRNVFFVPQPGSNSVTDQTLRNWDNDTANLSIYRIRHEEPEGSATKNLYLNGSSPQLASEGNQWIYYQYGPTGRLQGEGVPEPIDNRIVLARGRPQPGAPILENEQEIRGLFLRRVGSFSLFNEPLPNDL